MEENENVFNEEDKVEIRSEEIRDILGRKPNWMIRWGITLIFIIIGGIFFGSYLIKYPDVISATITVTTDNLPANAVAKMSGKIDTVFVCERQNVREGQYLALIESHAEFIDVENLKLLMDSLHDGIFDEHTHRFLQLPENMQLGDLQTSYFAFLKSYKDYDKFLKDDYHNKKITSLESQVIIHRSLYKNSLNQSSLVERQLKSNRQLFGIDSTLYKQGVISLSEFEKSRNNFLQAVYAYDVAKAGLDNMRLNISQLEQTIFDVNQQRSDEIKKLQIDLVGNYDKLQSELRNWDQLYLIKSPIEGMVTFTKFWQKNQNVTSGNIVITVVPCDSTRIVGKISLPMQGAGKVKVGQSVNVKFDHYPYMEFGMVKGNVLNISLVPEEDKYMVEVGFPNGLTTNYSKKLAFSQQMKGTADIITEDLRLLERFLNPIRSVLKR